MAKSAAPRPLAEASRSSDEALPSPDRRPLRLAISSTAERDLREVQEAAYGLRSHGRVTGLRIQTPPRRESPAKIAAIAGALPTGIVNRWERDPSDGSQSNADARFYRCPASERNLRDRGFDLLGIEYDDAVASQLFDRLRGEIGFNRLGSEYCDFAATFYFLSAALTFPPDSRVRSTIKRYVPGSIQKVRGGRKFILGSRFVIVPGLRAREYKFRGVSPVKVSERGEIVPGNWEESLLAIFGVKFRDADSGEPLFFVTEIEDVGGAVCEAIDAILEGRLANRPFPFPCPWTDDPFSPPDRSAIRPFVRRWGIEQAKSQEALRHVLRTFYEPADSPETVAIPSKPAGGKGANARPSDEEIRDAWHRAHHEEGTSKAEFARDYAHKGWLPLKHKDEAPKAALDRLLDRLYIREKRANE